MTHSSKYEYGISTIAIVIIVAAILLGAGITYYSVSPTSSPAEEFMEMEDDRMMEDTDHTITDTNSAMPVSGDAMVEERDAMMKTGDDTMVKFSGAVLAGTSAPLLDFNQADYDAALQANKIVVLYYYANWCPICREEFPKAQAAFNQLSADNVVGFRVNFNDNQTDDTEKALAREHGVAYQHTKVIIKNGKPVLKSPETWTQDRYLTEITKATAN